MLDYKIRKIKFSEIYLLETFLYEAIFQKDEQNLLPKEVIKQPELHVYIKDFGKDSDFCLVADANGEIIGAVWARILSGSVKGFGNIDEHTPEFAISVLKDFRGFGIGTALMKEMLLLLKSKGYCKTSLAVQKDNYAVRMYKDVGFEIIGENEEEYIMVCNL